MIKYYFDWSKKICDILFQQKVFPYDKTALSIKCPLLSSMPGGIPYL